MPTPLWMDNLRVNRRLFDLDRSIGLMPHCKRTWRSAIAVGTGPSLERNVSILAHRPDDCLVIACETAYAYLVSKSIIPNIVITAEEQMPVALAFAFLEGWFPSCALVASTTACSLGLSFCRDRGADIYFYNSAHPMLVQDGRYIVGALPRRVPALTPACGSILFHAVALAKWMGIADVALMGADFGVEIRPMPGGGSRCDKTHAGGWRVDGIPPEAINQSFDWHIHELKARPIRAMRIVNCSEGGRLDVFPNQTAHEWLVSLYGESLNVAQDKAVTT